MKKENLYLMKGGIYVPWVNDNCRGCRRCIKVCMFKAISMDGDKAVINMDQCVLCGNCLNDICPFEAIRKDDEA